MEIIPSIDLLGGRVVRLEQGDYARETRFDRAPADATELAAILTVRRNDLTAAAMSQVPQIADVLAALESVPGALLARMTGSGATCFALFADFDGAHQAALDLARHHPEWWSQAATLETDILDL